jgi:FixJ family two-component response regulator
VTDNKTIAIVDDDESVRESLPALLESAGFRTLAFGSALEFLEFEPADEIGCLILDVAMPGMSGPELYCELNRRGRLVPTIFITAHSSEGTESLLERIGASTCLIKPFQEEAILGAVRTALVSHSPS